MIDWRPDRRLVKRGGVALVALFAVVQLVPYGWQHPNPAVVQDAPWPGTEGAEIARSACYDCHSNETRWPLYTWVAPVSWVIRNSVEEGRHELNFSVWPEVSAHDLDESIETVLEGEMPPREYTLLHPSAKLDDGERAVLVDALREMDAPLRRRGGDDGREDDDDDD
ncbi:MAG: heme-binding domain-containing protein [Acidimicrobiales bacterium]